MSTVRSPLRVALDLHERRFALRNSQDRTEVLCKCGWRDYFSGGTYETWEDHREAAVRAALAQDAPIGEAWQKVIEALPEGWCTSLAGPDLYGRWIASAGPNVYDRDVDSVTSGDAHWQARHVTPQAALIAVRDALLERQT